MMDRITNVAKNKRYPSIELRVFVLYNKVTGEITGPYSTKEQAISEEREGFRARSATMNLTINRGRIH